MPWREVCWMVERVRLLAALRRRGLSQPVKYWVVRRSHISTKGKSETTMPRSITRVVTERSAHLNQREVQS